MKISEAIILAGGKGTRLQSIVKNTPKPMAEVHGRPFLTYLLDYLQEQSIRKIIFSVGYKRAIIQNFFGKKYNNIDIVYSYENTPLGTGGAIKKALSQIEQNDVFVCNGDTFFPIPLAELYQKHHSKNSDLSLSLAEVPDNKRYSGVCTDHNNKIISFTDTSNIINGGLYCIKKNIFDNINMPKTFSFEHDFLEKLSGKWYGFLFHQYFIDIGIPADYQTFIKVRQAPEHPLNQL
jgi:D-glycero-alpha-D-manno-heptose 1-phosphate guanylyltransferase